MEIMSRWGSLRLSSIIQLVEQGADIEYATVNGETCLMKACWECDFEVVQYLLSKGAIVDNCDQFGRNALHYCCLSPRRRGNKSHFEIAKMLIQHNISLSHDYVNMTAVKAAAINGKQDLVEFFIGIEGMELSDTIEALELLGVYSIHSGSPDKAFKNFWCRSLKVRQKQGIEKELSSSLTVFGFPNEFNTEEEVSTLQDNLVHLQAVLVAHRLLGVGNDLTASLMLSEISDKASCLHLSARLDLLLYLFSHRAELFSTLNDEYLTAERSFNILSCRQIFTLLKSNSSYLNAAHILECYDFAIQHLFHKMSCRDFSANFTSLCQYFMWIVFRFHARFKENERIRFRQLTRAFLKKNEISNKMSWLRMVLDLPEKMSTKTVASLVLSLECGADPNQRDQFGYLPIHQIHTRGIESLQDRLQLSYCSEILHLLVDFGAHLDARDHHGNKADISKWLSHADYFSLLNKTSLQCLSCQVIQQYQLDFSVLPESLQKVVAIH